MFQNGTNSCQSAQVSHHSRTDTLNKKGPKGMSRRPLFFIAVILCLLTGLPAHPSFRVSWHTYEAIASG